MKKALITGITGQDGGWLAALLLDKGYQVFGGRRRSASGSTWRLDELGITDRINFVPFELQELPQMIRLLRELQPDEIYNLAAQSVHPETVVPIMLTGQAIKVQTIETLWRELEKKHEPTVVPVRTEGGVVETEVIALTQTQLRALGYWAGMGTWFPIRQISRHRYVGKMCELRQKWGRIVVTPNHSVYDVNGRLRSPVDNPELLPMRKINFHAQGEAVCEVELKLRGHGHIDGEWIACTSDRHPNGMPTKVKRFLRASDGSLRAFLELAGAYISEGNLCILQSGSHQITITNGDREWIDRIAESIALITTAKTWVTEQRRDHHATMYHLQCSSRTLYAVLEKYCGIRCAGVHIPDFFFRVDRSNWSCLLDNLIKGDGWKLPRPRNVDEDQVGYVTTSPILAAQLGLIWTMLGKDYSVEYLPGTDRWAPAYRLRQATHYRYSCNDKEYREVDHDGYVYDIAVDQVENFCCGVGNVVVHNSFVHISFDHPLYTFDINAVGVLRLLEAVKTSCPQARFYSAQSSEQFGNSPDVVRSFGAYNEESAMQPRSPYGYAKLAAYWAVRNAREAKGAGSLYGIFASNGILFNHESEFRGMEFVTRKIANGVARLAAGEDYVLRLGNLDAKRDFGYAREYVEAMWLILQQDQPDDFVVATGETHSVREFLEHACSAAGVDMRTRMELGQIIIDPAFVRPAEVDVLLGDASKIRRLGWKPKTKFHALARLMVEAEQRRIRRG